MPKYRFTTDDGEHVERGEEAVDLPSNEVAADEAQKALVDIARDKLPDGSRADFHARVEDADGNDVYRASLKFRGETADETRAAQLEADRCADEAAEAIARALSSDEK